MPARGLTEPLAFGPAAALSYVRPEDMARIRLWIAEGHSQAMKTPDDTLIYVAPEQALEIRRDQVNCMGCLSACKFSNWSCADEHTTGKPPDPRSFCIQKTLHEIAHGADIRLPADVRRPQRLQVPGRSFLFQRLHPDRAPAGRPHRDRRLSGTLDNRGHTGPFRYELSGSPAVALPSLRDGAVAACRMGGRTVQTMRTYSRALERLKAAGLRPTRQRLALAKLLLESGPRHVTAEELFHEARSAGIPVSLATVYNTLHQFTSVGLLREVVVDLGQSYFDTNTSHHHHFSTRPAVS